MASGQKGGDSAYDFLYADLRRIGVLLSHLTNDGILQQITRETTTGQSRERGLEKFIKISGTEDASRSKGEIYDPQWLLPLLFLDRTQGRLKRNMRDARIGDLTLLRGSLHILDTAFLQSMYSKDSLRTIAERNALERATKAGAEFNYEAFDLELELLTSTESQIQLHFDTWGEKMWSTLRDEALMTPASELAVKHGAAISGDWYLLSIKDADPIHTADQYLEHETKLRERFNDMPMLAEAVDMMNHVRRVFGRPVGAYGVTPLLIFRELGKPTVPAKI